ncbi:exodeoxyribonuclease V subunit alpha [Luteibacter yeojuensis]|uniref:RecBCD enzyme subunit RecD n=1 Tax=Luteibacter yeojuensis TaxID=345309 RepID=A0A7X5TNX2_9GAMM|nr:exodeoxyribonuclease V subunit alpha [Luteibacter yeojuensis]NID13892.1 exodeoxyribonuclease V subunit alpha [Luteibacter yeojuensis]
MIADSGTWLDRALAEGRIDTLDRAFARFLRELDPAVDPRVQVAAALLSHELGEGHICMPLDTLREREPELGDPADFLGTADVVAQSGGDASAPLVLENGLLYMRRFWRDEAKVAQAIRDRLGERAASVDLRSELARLFPDEGFHPDWQKVACAIAARSGFAVITGGPGTGKTTTVVRLLGLLQTLALRDGGTRLRIRLAAPTGKAAARLNASIAGQVAQLQVDPAVKQAIPAEVTTLHRLLGSRPDTRAFRHDAENPLHVDVLVVDEASMIDLEMMAATLDALPPGARLVLLGDKDQLSSVEAGAVLGDLCARAEAGHYSSATRDWIREVCDEDVSAWTDAPPSSFRGQEPSDPTTLMASPLDQHIAMLRHSRRFGSDSGIGALAAAINDGDVGRALAVFDAFDDLALGTPSPAAIATLAIEGRDDAPGYRHYLDWIERERPPVGAGDDDLARWARGALRAYAGFQLLCATRQGEHGVLAQNARIAQGLRDRGLIEATGGWYEGRPVILTRNDYALGLMNGDVGVTLWIPDGQGGMALRVAFAVMDERGGERIRFVVPSRLAAVETVYAMTVHKSQGSEFEHTALTLPPEPSPVLTRELVYTGVTRARQWFTLLAVPAILGYAAQRKTQRASGLLRRLL